MKTNLSKYLRARRPIIWVHSGDYKEVDTIVKEATKEYENKAIFEYRAFGAINFETKVKSDEIVDLYSFLNILFSEGVKTNVFLIIKNAEEEMKDAKNIALIKKIAETRYSNSDYNFTVIVVTEVETVPKDLEKFTSILDIPNMTKDEIEKYIWNFAKENNVNVDKNDVGEVAISLKGLTKLEIDHVLNMIIESKKNISISGRDIIIREKGQIIKKSSILEIIDFKEKIEEIGGLEGLKEWLSSKAQVFRRLDEAKKFGVDTPKGVLLVGMPGCGKSLAAKASARLFNVPLLRLDIGRLLGKYVGESEHNMRVALKTAESISPCILWIDEIEKAFAGIDQNGGASDITKRLFGQFLTWLQEKENTVFVVATANDITAFPPEFLRKGRFDEVFFIDFPNEEEREKIFEIHLEKRGKMSDDINLKELAEETEGYCGADIEEIVKNAVENKFILETENEEDKKITTNNLLEATKSIDSLSNILSDKIDILKKSYKKFKIKSASQKIKNGKRIAGRPIYDFSTFNENLSIKINQLGGKSVYPNIADFKKTEGFRLPTEVEWEWFARGGEVAIQDGTFNYDYSGSNNLDEVAWHHGNSGEQTHDVGIKKPNQLGLYDCSGNVWEWCYDTNSDGYISENTPYIYDEIETGRRIRGGSCRYVHYTPEENKLYYRDYSCYNYITINYSCGFRIVRTI